MANPPREKQCNVTKECYSPQAACHSAMARRRMHGARISAGEVEHLWLAELSSTHAWIRPPTGNDLGHDVLRRVDADPTVRIRGSRCPLQGGSITWRRASGGTGRSPGATRISRDTRPAAIAITINKIFNM